MSIKLVIFDLDDTLYPEIEFVMSGFREVSKIIAKDFKISCNYIFKMLKNEYKKDRKFVFNRVIEEFESYDVDYVKKLVDIYRTHKPKINLYDDVNKILPILKNYLYLGIITDGYPITQMLKIKALEIESYFDKIIYTGEKEGYSKPSSLPFLDILREFSLSPYEAIYIGDNIEKDFKGPKEIGITSVKISRNGIYKNAIPLDESYKPDSTINSLLEILDVFEISK